MKILNWGRRTGKSFLAKIECLDRAINKGQNVWWYSPTFSSAAPHWRELKKLIGDAPFITYKNEQQRYLEFASGGSIEIKSADRYDTTRGVGLHFVVLDEAAFMAEQVWTEIVQPSLLDHGGQAMIISTPKGKQNWFYTMYLMGQSGDPDYYSRTCTTYENPYIPRKGIEKLRLTMTAHTFRQEILAEFLDNAGGAFNGIERVSTLELVGKEQGAEYVAGIDWGRKNDYTVIAVFHKTRGHQVDLQRFTDIGYDYQLNLVRKVLDKWEPSVTFVETNSMGGPLFERLQNDVPYKLRGVYMTNPVKRKLVERFAAAIEKESVRLLKPNLNPHITAQYYELGSYELKRLANGAGITYSAPIGGHDDTVMALMLAYQGVKRPGYTKSFYEAENVFFR